VDSRLAPELDAMVTKFYGPRDQAPEDKVHTPSVEDIKKLSEAVVEQDFIIRMLTHLPSLGFEARKKVVWITQYIITNCKELAVPYFLKNKKLFTTLVNCYENSDTTVVVNYDNILGTCIQNKDLAEFILTDSALVLPFFKHMESPTAGMDSFSTFKLLMTDHKGVPASDFIRKNYEMFVKHYNTLLQSSNFLTKVQAFQLLNELLCARVNFDVMVKYINDASNLALVMMALRGGKAQQTAVFHVLKIFVGNPRKSAEVSSILSLNKENLISFVTRFGSETEDPRLERDKEAMLKMLKDIKDVTTTGTTTTGTTTDSRA